MLSQYDIVLKVKLQGDGIGSEELVGIYDMTAGNTVMPLSIRNENHVTAMGFMSIRAAGSVNFHDLISRVEETVRTVVGKWELEEADASYDGEIMDGLTMYIYNDYQNDPDEEDEDAVYRIFIRDGSMLDEAVGLLDREFIKNSLDNGDRIMVFGKYELDKAAAVLDEAGIDWDEV